MSDQRLSVTFGAFSCDVVGYDDPFAILTRVVELFGEIAKSNPAFGAGEVRMSDMERAKVAAGLADQASRIEELADQSSPNGMRYVVSNGEADAPEITDVPEMASEEEFVIAAEADDATNGSDLELRDTLEAISAEEPALEDEVVALDIAPTTPVIEEEEIAAEAPLELTAQDETPVIVDTPAEDDEPLVLEAVAAAPEAPVLETPADETTETPLLLDDGPLDDTTFVASDFETEDLDVVETVLEDDAADLPEIADAPASPLADVKPEVAPVRQPLRLNMNSHGVEPKLDDAPVKAAEADAPAKKADTRPDKPQRRVTVTKLPLRPIAPKPVEQAETHTRHSLSPVQKVEPVVTFGASIGDSANETPQPSRADRIRAKLEKRASEDDGENFLFADVGEVQDSDTQADLEADDNALPLAIEAAVAKAPAPVDEPAKKPRRSIANLLGFGKSAAAEPEPVVDLPTPTVRNEDDYKGGTDGFVRLRESVAAAMPAPEQTNVSYPAAKAPPESISEAIDYDDETSPTAFARRVGANTLQDLLEASAVYMDVVEGKSRFSRRDVMKALNQIGADNDYTQEARLKSFRKLLTTGSLVRVDDGMFTVSQSTRFGYETRLQA